MMEKQGIIAENVTPPEDKDALEKVAADKKVEELDKDPVKRISISVGEMLRKNC